MRNKFERFSQPWFHPDVLMIGSSLSRETFALTDAYVLHRRPPSIGYELNVYGKSIYLEDKLRQITGKEHTALDLSVGGCMASDTYFLLKSALELRPNIRLLILPLAPRDFVDNNSAPDPEKSAVCSLLKKKSLNTIVSPDASSNEKFECALSSFWYFFDTRADYKRILQILTCQSFNRSLTLHGAAHFEDPNSIDNRVVFNPPRKSAETVLSSAYKEEHAKNSARQYNPYNSRRLKLQFQYMEKTLNLCRGRGISVVVIDMPLPERNRKYMTAELQSQYEANLQSVCKKYSTGLILLQTDSEFVDSDFHDSWHVVGSGGKKVLDRLVQHISMDRTLIASLSE